MFWFNFTFHSRYSGVHLSTCFSHYFSKYDYVIGAKVVKNEKK